MSDWLWRYWRPVKFLWQRLTRGWDDSDLWSLDYAIIKFVYPRLKAFRELPPRGTPMHPTEVYPKGHYSEGTPRALTTKEWDAILDEILKGFALALEDECYPLWGEEHEQLERSLDLFREWFFALWD